MSSTTSGGITIGIFSSSKAALKPASSNYGLSPKSSSQISSPSPSPSLPALEASRSALL